ncbi:MAG TPA: DUF4274 domain-containing protein [Allosphingosinicella sp.]
MKPLAAFAILCVALVPAGLAACGSGAENASMSHGADALPRLRVDTRLREMGPDGWHRVALYANRDFVEPEVWRWIVAQPDCDRATALAIFWQAGPDYYVAFADRESVPPVNRDGYELVTSIRDRWLAGAYRRAELAFDRTRDAAPVDLDALERRYGDRVARMIPPSMRAPLPGRRIADDGAPLPGTLRPS